MIFALRFPGVVRCLDLRGGGYHSTWQGATGLIAGESEVLDRFYGIGSMAAGAWGMVGRLAAGERDEDAAARTLYITRLLNLHGARLDSEILPRQGHNITIYNKNTDDYKLLRPDRYKQAGGTGIPLGGTPAAGVASANRSAPWTLDASRRSDGAYSFQTGNIRYLALNIPLPAAPACFVDGQSLELDEGGPPAFEKSDLGWRRCVGGMPPQIAKLRGGMFSVADARFIVVKGTRIPTSNLEIDRRVDRILDWWTSQNPGAGTLDVVPDTDFSPDMVMGANLWLVGSQLENSAYDKVVGASLPKELADLYRVLEGKRQVFFNFKHVSPASPRSVVYVEQSNSAIGYRMPIMPNAQFDYSISSVNFISNKIECRGFFDNEGAYDKSLHFDH